MNRQFNRLLILAVLLIPSLSFANSIPVDVRTRPTISMVSIPVIQSLPIDDKAPALWLTGRFSFVGGEVSSSEQQFRYAVERQIPLMTNENTYQTQLSSGYFVRLESPFLDVHAKRPYVLPSTFTFVIEMSKNYYEAGCGRLVVKDALRLTSERPSNGSAYSVHPAGMAVDIRVNGIGERCETWLNDYLIKEETKGMVDATREYWKWILGHKVPNPHFHIVVPLEPRGPNLVQSITYTSVGAP